MARLSLSFHQFQPCLHIPQPPQITANPLQPHNNHKIRILACQTNPKLHQSSPTEKSVGEIGNNSKGTSSLEVAPPKFPSKDIKKKIAVVSFLAALGLFSSSRFHFGAPLKDHCAHALPSQEALSKGKPTEVEFYEDWCEVCGESAPDHLTYETVDDFASGETSVLWNKFSSAEARKVHQVVGATRHG
ncbi:hypothetical protein RJT34_30640 [Clitoria ternatea]|uniref:Uncharacterized protein n=1 Tax=Clitoria ternatea TaxID=43366 RepID=A0AAN9EUZ3_CLITE